MPGTELAACRNLLYGSWRRQPSVSDEPEQPAALTTWGCVSDEQLESGDCNAYRIIDCLTLGAIDGICRHDRTTVHDAAPKERLAFVRVVAIIQQHLVQDRDGTGALAPNSDLVRVTAKSRDIVCNPFQAQALIKQAQVCRPICKYLLAR